MPYDPITDSFYPPMTGAMMPGKVPSIMISGTWKDEYGFEHERTWPHGACRCPICSETQPENIKNEARQLAYDRTRSAYSNYRSGPTYSLSAHDALEIAYDVALRLAERLLESRQRSLHYIHKEYDRRFFNLRNRITPRVTLSVPDTQGRLFREEEHAQSTTEAPTV